MKKGILLTLCFILLTLNISGEEHKTIKVSFNKEQFSFETDANNALVISSNAHTVGYGTDLNKPGLPLIPINVRIQNGYMFDGMNIDTDDKKLLFENVNVAPNPERIATNYTESTTHKVAPVYKSAAYPSTNVEYVMTSTMDGYTILRFLVCPFEYNAIDKKLYLAENVSFDINLKETASVSTMNAIQVGNNMKSVVDNTIINADEFANEDEEIAVQADITITPAPMRLRYVIVTSSELAESFKPLMRWKMMKGLKSRIVTTEEIYAKYPNMSKQLAIKTYLYNLYKDEGLTYALLGGDDMVVPAQYCYTYTNERKEHFTPADLFYACFSKNFSWNKNNDTTLGTTNTEISIDPDIFVTRAPVRTQKDVSTFVNRIIEYEQNPLKYGWNNNILMSGNKLFYIKSGQSDAEINGNNVYTQYIKPYWNGTIKRFYDTYTDFNGGASYELNGANLQYQLQQGYTFADVNTHGVYNKWCLESDSFYDNEYAETLKNNGYTLIVTDACHTNAFDTDPNYKIADPCLSETFIRNSNSGIIAYWGSSREGWIHTGTEGGPSFEYRCQLYKSILSSSYPKAFGVAATEAKQAMVTISNVDDYVKRLQFSINPIGDPEMPVYTTVPSKFNMATMSFGFDGTIKVYSGVEGCTIAFLGLDDDKASQYYVENNTKSASFKTNQENYAICITKPNYIPYVYINSTSEEQLSKIEKCVASTNTLNISTQIATNAQKADIVLTSAYGNKVNSYKVSKEEPTISSDISALTNGVYSISLIIDGKTVDAKSFIKK